METETDAGLPASPLTKKKKGPRRGRPEPFSPDDGRMVSPLLSPVDAAELLRMPSAAAARKWLIRHLPPDAFVRLGRLLRIRRTALFSVVGLEEVRP